MSILFSRNILFFSLNVAIFTKFLFNITIDICLVFELSCIIYIYIHFLQRLRYNSPRKEMEIHFYPRWSHVQVHLILLLCIIGGCCSLYGCVRLLQWCSFYTKDGKFFLRVLSFSVSKTSLYLWKHRFRPNFFSPWSIFVDVATGSPTSTLE